MLRRRQLHYNSNITKKSHNCAMWIPCTIVIRQPAQKSPRAVELTACEQNWGGQGKALSLSRVGPKQRRQTIPTQSKGKVNQNCVIQFKLLYWGPTVPPPKNNGPKQRRVEDQFSAILLISLLSLEQYSNQTKSGIAKAMHQRKASVIPSSSAGIRWLGRCIRIVQ